ncbi:MAG: TolB family protein [Planctomycetota bacterium]
MKNLVKTARDIPLRYAFGILLCCPMYLSASSDLYPGQSPPRTMPQVFLPGIVSTDEHETDVTFSPDLGEIYFTRTGADWYSVIYVSRYQDGAWSDPERVSFSAETSKNYPFFSPDGRKLFFDSTGQTGAASDRDIWYVLRDGDDWGLPRQVGSRTNTPSTESFAGVSGAGHLYFGSRREGELGGMDIYRAELGEEGYEEATNLGEAVNSVYGDFHPFVDAMEQYIVFDSQRLGGGGANDLYVSFRQPDGSWSKAVNAVNEINSSSGEMRPCVSPDGKYLFFCSNRGGNQDIYWVDAVVIRP